MTLTRRLGLIVAAVLLLALAGAGLVQGWTLHQALQQLLAQRNQDAASAFAAELGPREGDLPAVRDWAARRAGELRLSHLWLRGHEGELLADIVPAQRTTATPGGWSRPLSFAVPAGRAPVAEGAHGVAELQLQTDAAWAQEALWQAGSRLVAALLLLAAAAAALMLLALRRWQRPLAAILLQAQALEQGRYLQAEETALPELPELRGLARSMNATVMRLREMFAAQAEQVALLQRQAQLDPITGLPLRQAFLGQLQQRLEEPGAPPVALLLVRLLHLESLNPRLGHDTTDRLLGAIADVLQTYVDRVPGTFAGRLNGPDFALCLPVAGVAQETAESLRAALAAVPALRVGGAEAVVGGVDGLHDCTPGAALAAADAALARAEDSEGVAVERQGDLVADSAGARAWREQIGAALAEGRARLAEFKVVDRNGATVQLECPLRVQLHVDGEYLAAARWLALARRSRLMPQVDLMAVELALRAIAADGQPRAVHASLLSLAAPEFIAEVAALLQAAPGAAARLAIEIVEGARPQGRAQVAEAAAVWSACGVRVGVEHAQATPQELPGLAAAGVRYVQVQSRHLRGLAADEAVRGYARSLVALIHGLGLQAVADGLGEAADLEAAWALGFDAATGTALVPA